MRSILINGRPVGPGHPCFVIAEPGSNHNGSLETALKLIDVAADAGADAVKFQTFRAEEHYVRKTPQFSYLRDLHPDVSTFELIKRNEMPRSWHAVLKSHADKRGILFLSTPSDRAAVDELVDQHAMAAIKIASFEAVDLSFIDYCARKGKPLIVATGMCSLGDVEDILATTQRAGNPDVVILHCVSLYPTQPDQVNLRAMQTLEGAFGLPVGLSDHTLGIEVPLAAVALGACVIEKHYTLDRTLSGPDHPFAIEPDELKAMVAGIRKVQQALGTPLKRQLPEEAEMARLGRRSITTRVPIPQGTVITSEMLVAKRPGYGIAPKFLPLLIGRTARRTIEADEVVTWEMV
jgi:sialic acid synthase SpsE